MTYVVITLVVLLILNIYCSIACQNLFYESKKSSMIEKCLLASDEVSTLEVMNSSTVSAVIGQIESLKASRLLVTDQAGCTLYDSSGAQVGSYALLPEILTALEGNDVCSWKYRSGTIDCRAATPVFYYGTIVGCVYMTDFDTTQGKLIQSLQRTIFFITFLLEAVVLVVLADKTVGTHVYDGSLVMGNLMLAAHALGVDSCWIHLAKEEFESPEGKALLRKLGIEGEWEGIGHCVLGYRNGKAQDPAPRKHDYVTWA